MEKFTRLSGTAAPLDMINVDTDMIIPKQFLKTIARTGLGRHLFDELRYDENGAEKPDFILNRPGFREAVILIAGDNFGCGSSREHAPWALADFGIRCVIAPGFADIFHGNCLKNGILPVTLPRPLVDALLQKAARGANARFTVDLEESIITDPDGEVHAFTLDAGQRTRLLEGLDDIALTLRNADAITAYEDRRRPAAPWVFRDAAA